MARVLVRAHTGFAVVAPLFEAQREQADREDWEQFELVCRQIIDAGITLRPRDDAPPVTEFLLRIEGSSARLRY